MTSIMSSRSNVTRQPFGLLDGGRLRNLCNMKNTQNTISTVPGENLKRRHEASNYDDLDSENVDPTIYSSPAKKSKIGFKDGYESPSLTKLMVNTPTSITKSSLARPIRSRCSDPISSWSLGNKPTTPADSVTFPTPKNIESAPAVAGRSPKSKRIGILSRRRMAASPFTRVNPPSFSSNGIQGGLPFSIDAALSGTVPSYKPSPVPASKVNSKEFCTLEEAKPKGWFFDIYEETEDMQEQNVVLHRACNLDISDDESLAGIKADKGKENIPPNDGFSASLPEVTTSIIASRMTMTDEPRTPLGDLEASAFYAEGCDASSYILIPGDNPSALNADKPNVEASKQNHPFSDYYPLHSLDKDVIGAASSVDIWESESAKDENESHDLGQLGQYAA